MITGVKLTGDTMQTIAAMHPGPLRVYKYGKKLLAGSRCASKSIEQTKPK